MSRLFLFYHVNRHLDRPEKSGIYILHYCIFNSTYSRCSTSDSVPSFFANLRTFTSKYWNTTQGFYAKYCRTNTVHRHIQAGEKYATEITRETRKGWHLLTVETEVNGDSKSTNERDPSLVGSSAMSCRYKYKSFLFCLGCSSRPSTKYIFFLAVHYFNAFISIAQQAGQAVMLGCLSLSMCLWK